ncbi:hypothetical protein Bca4012_067367 [Brassica carinata]
MRKRKGYSYSHERERLDAGGRLLSPLSGGEELLAEDDKFLAAKACEGVSYFLGRPLFLLTGSIGDVTADDGTERGYAAKEDEDPS